jgi:hypothetical protein
MGDEVSPDLIHYHVAYCPDSVQGKKLVTLSHHLKLFFCLQQVVITVFHNAFGDCVKWDGPIAVALSSQGGLEHEVHRRIQDVGGLFDMRDQIFQYIMSEGAPGPLRQDRAEVRELFRNLQLSVPALFDFKTVPDVGTVDECCNQFWRWVRDNGKVLTRIRNIVN